MPVEERSSGVRQLLNFLPLQIAAVVMLLLAIAFPYCEQKLCVLDPDLWWHLKVGDWILAHHEFPHNGVLTYTALDRSWAAYSWGYEVVLSRVYAWWGCEGVGWFGLLLTLAVAGFVLQVTFWLSRRFWMSVVLATSACCGFLFSLMPRPFFVSIILFTFVLALLLESRRQGRAELLYALPAIFFVWANIHIQFVYGLMLVALFVLAEVAMRILERIGLAGGLSPSRLRLDRVLMVAAASVLSTLLTPYGIRLYEVIYKYSQSKFAYNVVLELQAVDFRRQQHFVMLLLSCVAMGFIGWRRRVDAFQLVLLPIAALISFRTTRDSWVQCVSAAAILATNLRVESDEEESSGNRVFGLREALLISVATLLFTFLLARNTGFDRKGMEEAMRRAFPLDAALFLQQNPQPGPLYNTLDWGGFLAFALPQYPVAIDGRNDLFGDDLDQEFYRTQMGLRAPDSDPYLRGARIVLLQADCPLAKILLSDQDFRLTYRDSMAVIYLRR